MVFYYLHWIFSYICGGLFFLFPLLSLLLFSLLPLLHAKHFSYFPHYLHLYTSVRLAHTQTNTKCYLSASGWKNFLSALLPPSHSICSPFSFPQWAKSWPPSCLGKWSKKINGWLNENPASWQEEKLFVYSYVWTKSDRQKSKSSESLKPMAAANFRLCSFLLRVAFLRFRYFWSGILYLYFFGRLMQRLAFIGHKLAICVCPA